MLIADLKTPSRVAARSSLHPSPKFVVYSLRSGELPTKVQRAFLATSNISGEFCFHSKVSLVVLFSVVYLFTAIHHRLIIPHVRGTTMAGLTIIFSGHLRPPLAPPPSRCACGPNLCPTLQPRAALFAPCPCREHGRAGRWPCACDHILRAVRVNRPHSGPARGTPRPCVTMSPACRGPALPSMRGAAADSSGHGGHNLLQPKVQDDNNYPFAIDHFISTVYSFYVRFESFLMR
jgi:hypothetical protein